MMVDGSSDGSRNENGVKSDSLLDSTRQVREGIEKFCTNETDRKHLLSLLNNVDESHIRRTKIIQLVKESIGQLSLDMKYLVFDLEATRRERDRNKDIADRNKDIADMYLGFLNDLDDKTNWEEKKGPDKNDSNEPPEPGNGS